MIEFSSLPSAEASNLDVYWEVVRRLEPEFYLLRLALKETGVNPMIMPKIIRAIANLYNGTRYGKIQIFMTNGQITSIKPEETDLVEEEAVIDNNKT